MTHKNLFQHLRLKQFLSYGSLLNMLFAKVLVVVQLSILGDISFHSVVHAAEIGFVRLGDNYQYSTVPEGKGYHWCARLCAKDDKCKSWTFLRPTRQCRLKSAVSPKYKNECCVSGENKGELNSSPTKLCRLYANRAIADYEKNLIGHCGFSGGKWTGDFAVHFEWCMKASVEDGKQREKERANALKQCKQDVSDNGGNVSCRKYARKAMAQQHTNIDHKCGFNNKLRWRDDFDYYRKWCRENTVQEQNKQDKLKQVAIARCLKRGGGSFVRKCDDYAKAAMAHVKLASKNGCGFRDSGTWSRNFAAHYQFCAKNNSRRAVRNKLLPKRHQAREKALKQCKAKYGGWPEDNYGDARQSRLRAQAGGIEFGTLRVGANYSIKIAPMGLNYLWCEEGCRNDPRCKAWTFVKSNRQCRLQYGSGDVLKNECCVSGQKAAQSAAQSGKDKKSARCLAYSKKVIGLYDQSLKNQCSFEDKDWDNDFKGHYRSCMGKSERLIQGDLAAKQSLLRQCKAGKWQLDQRCASYAKQAVAQNGLNLSKNCGFSRKSRWHPDFTGHYDWCMNHSRFERDGQNDERQNFLAACLHRGGGQYSAPCDKFTQAALLDVKKGKELNCGLNGKDWSTAYEDHYQWCLGSDNWQRRSEANTRARSLKRCEANGGGKSQVKARCNHFARLSAEQSRSNATTRCGFQYEHWQMGANVADLEKWCLKAKPEDAERRFKERESDLKSCFARFTNNSTSKKEGQDKACVIYARTALKQYSQGLEQHCQLRGSEWSDEYDDHYDWCVKASPLHRKRLIFSRNTVLKTCKVNAFFNFGR